ncbi:hypothetical protein BH11ACT7_BH11ACT7_01800 [soil metagenome]
MLLQARTYAAGLSAVLAALGVNGLLGARVAASLFHQGPRKPLMRSTSPSGPRSWPPESKAPHSELI